MSHHDGTALVVIIPINDTNNISRRNFNFRAWAMMAFAAFLIAEFYICCFQIDLCKISHNLLYDKTFIILSNNHAMAEFMAGFILHKRAFCPQL